MTAKKTLNNPPPQEGAKGKSDRRMLWSYFDPKEKKHLYILSLAIQYGWRKEHPKTGREVADLGALDGWLKGKHKSGQSPVQRPMMEMDNAELSKVITALENIVAQKHKQ